VRLYQERKAAAAKAAVEEEARQLADAKAKRQANVKARLGRRSSSGYG